MDTSAVFGQPAGMKDQITELTEPYHMLDESTESQQLFLPLSHPQPVRPPSPKPVYHNEVSEGSVIPLIAFSNKSVKRNGYHAV